MSGGQSTIKSPSLHTLGTGLGARHTLACGLHVTAGIVLMLFAASHFMFLRIDDPNSGLVSTVFPFLTNRHLYLATGMLEMFIGLVCVSKRGHTRTNLLIITFVAIIGWYRWAFQYTGGKYCGCLGLLGKLLHVSKRQEEIIPIAALVSLMLTTLPWISQMLLKLRKPFFRKHILFLACWIILQKGYGNSTIRIDGTVDLQDYNPNTGSPYTDQQSHSLFTAVISDNAWEFSITNRDQPIRAAVFIYDGTNSYTITPFERALMLPLGGVSKADSHLETNLQMAVIEPSPRFVVRESENLGLSMIWLTYGLRPQLVKSNKAGLIEIPMLSGAPRQNPGAFGYKWNINNSTDGRFVEACDIVRDRSLDLTDNQELLRPELDYPETVGQYNEYVLNLYDRKEFPSGFLKAHLKCNAWLQTNDMTVATASRYEVFMRPGTKYPFRVVELKATSVSIVDQPAGNILPEVKIATRVTDYRFKRANQSRIFKYADYTLQKGDPWKEANDPVLLKQAEDWLLHGKKYTNYANTGRILAAWLLLALLCAPLIITLWFKAKTRKKIQYKL